MIGDRKGAHAYPCVRDRYPHRTKPLKREYMTLFLDFETRSAANLQAVGAHRYAQDASTSILLLSYAFDDAPVKTTAIIPEAVYEALANDDVLKVAHNAEFEMAVIRYVMGIPVNPACWFDTAYQAAYFGYPRALDHLAKMLRTKNKASSEEMMFFSTPRKSKDKTIAFNEMRDFPEEAVRFIEYSRIDVEVLREIYRAMPPLPVQELFAMRYTFEINFNGVPFDLKLAYRIYTKASEYSEKAGRVAKEKYGIDNLRSPKQVQLALFRERVVLTSLNKKEREGASHEILDLRDQATGAAFSKIMKAAERICPDGRLHGEFVGYGAHTGRWSSRGVQLQNFPHGSDDATADLANVRSYDHLRQHLRLCIYAGATSRSFVCADLSQIEARIVAWLAACEWRMTAFKNDEDIYARSAEKMFNIENVHKGMPERQMGKCAELGLGYGGGAGAIQRIAPDFYREQGETKVSEIVRVWRGANPEICLLWRLLEKAFLEAMKRGLAKLQCGQTFLTFKYDGRTATIQLPSGRSLYYRGTHVENGTIFYLDYSRGGENAVRTKMWGGTLLENVTQAIARDVLVDIMQRVKNRDEDSECVGSVHDEIWYVARDGETTLNILLEEMAHPISWAPGLVTKGDGFTDFRYVK